MKTSLQNTQSKNTLSGVITDRYCHLFNASGGAGKFRWYVVSSIRLDEGMD
ncbi:MAG: hypothetical protein SchgKO_02060 [Schleiferiaceae bacterium]